MRLLITLSGNKILRACGQGYSREKKLHLSGRTSDRSHAGLTAKLQVGGHWTERAQRAREAAVAIGRCPAEWRIARFLAQAKMAQEKNTVSFGS